MGELPSEWEVRTLGDLAYWFSGGTPRTSEASYWNGDIPWITSGSLTTFYLSTSDRTLTQKGLESGSRLVPASSILFVVRGMSLKSEFRIGITRRPLAFGQDCKALVAHADVDPLFLANAIRAQSRDILGMVDEAGHGTGRLATDRIRSLRVPLPPLSEQRAIAEVLGALDDKIEANRRVADLATNLALAQATSALEHVGGTPTDMERIADITKGVSYRSDDLIPGNGWLVSLKCVGRDGSFEPGGLKPFSGPAKPGQVVDDGDVLVAQTDLTQRGEVIGRPIRVQRLGLAGRFVASLDFAVVRPRPPLTRELLFGLLSQRVFREHVLGFCNGTTVLHMNSRALPSYQVAIPGAEQGRRLTNIMKPLFECSAVARRESSALGQLRDTLLPKLLSGELRVRDAESLVEEAV
jgi:type I restriction enzyme S subunit